MNAVNSFNLFNKLICIVLLITFCHMKTANFARVDIDNMDYESLIAMLAEAENVENYESATDLKPVANRIPQIHQAAIPNQKGISSNIDFTITKPSASSLLAPHVEILRLVEAFLQLKGEMAARIQALINDNFDLFHSIYNLIISKASKLHSFTLIGISVIRKILEFAVAMIGTWELNMPSISFGFDKIFNVRN